MPLNFSDQVPPALAPADLLNALTGSLCELQPLCDRLKCTVDTLEKALDSEELQQHLRVQTKLSLYQARLIATAMLPKLAVKLVALTDSEKPEVARRAINSLTEMAQPPKPPEPPKPEKASLHHRPDSDPDKVADQEEPRVPKIWEADSLEFGVTRLRALERDHGIDLSIINLKDLPLLADQIRKFIWRSNYGKRLYAFKLPPINQTPVKPATFSMPLPSQTVPNDKPQTETTEAPDDAETTLE